MATTARRRRPVARIKDGDYAKLKVDPTEIRRRMIRFGESARGLAALCGHASHTHVLRLLDGEINTTSPHTANVLEAALDARGLLFTRITAKTSDRAAA
jgi:hypothetical protein